MTSIDQNKPIEYRYLNMDNRCYTTQENLLAYARAFLQGQHRSVSKIVFGDGPVLFAYGTKRYSHDDMKALDEGLSQRRSGES